MGTALAEEISKLSISSRNAVIEFDDCLYYLKRVEKRDAKKPSEVDWTVEHFGVVDFISKAYANGEYGDITRLAVKRSGGEMVAQFSVDFPEGDPENHAKLPDVVYPPLKDGSCVCLRTEITQHGPYMLLSTMDQGVDVKTMADFCTFVGPLTHISHQNRIRAVSCAHVLTNFHPDMIGKPVGRRLPDGYHVSGQVPSAFALFPKDRKIYTPIRNKYDFAWCDLPLDTPVECLVIKGEGGYNDVQIGPPRKPIDGENVILYSKATSFVQGKVSTAAIQAVFAVRDNLKSYMDYGFEVDFGQDGAFITQGISGALVYATSDKALVGMLVGSGEHPEEGAEKFMCYIPDEWN